jgi:hypothetical protein
MPSSLTWSSYESINILTLKLLESTISTRHDYWLIFMKLYATFTLKTLETSPAHIRVTRNDQDLLVEFYVDLIIFILLESNDICHKN